MHKFIKKDPYHMSNLFTKIRKLVGFAPLSFMLMAGPAPAVELGLTPSHVFATWMNINETLIALGSTVDDSGALSDRIAAMKAVEFTGKKPGEVLKQLTVFRGKLNQLSAKHGQNPAAIFKDPAGGVVTPSVVFMNSGHVLDSTVLLLATLNEEQLISGFFTRYDISGKTPNGPYSLVDLANRRIDALLK